MIQLPVPSTIEAQPRKVTFLTMKTAVKKNPEKRRSDGLMCLDKAVLGQGGGGGQRIPHVHILDKTNGRSLPLVASKSSMDKVLMQELSSNFAVEKATDRN